MATIEHISIDGTSHDIRDNTKLPLSGGALTGTLTGTTITATTFNGSLNGTASNATNAATATKSNQILDNKTSTYKSATSETLTITKGDGTVVSFNVLTV